MPANNLSAAEVRSLYEKHGSALAAYGCCHGLDFASAEDVVQQVFLKLLEGQVSVPVMPLAYLYRAVRNASLNLRRNLQPAVEIGDRDTWLVSPDGNAEEALSVQAALRDLHEEQRETVSLKVWGGMTLAEIAETLEIPTNTAASRYRYAIEKIGHAARATWPFFYAGNDLHSHTLSRAVPSALRGLTSVFGMGTGGSPAV